MFKSQSTGETKAANPEVKVDRSRLVLLGALAATAAAAAGCASGRRAASGDGVGYGD